MRTEKARLIPLLLWVGTLALDCNNYNLLAKLENPGGQAPTGTETPSDPPPPPPPPPPPSTPRIFVTNATFQGNFGAISNADNFCIADSANPLGAGNGNWKAMLVDGTNRTTTTDWVLVPNRTYYRPDGTVIGTTDASALFTFPLTNAISTLNVAAWTGMFNTWVAYYHCSNWSTNSLLKKPRNTAFFRPCVFIRRFVFSESPCLYKQGAVGAGVLSQYP